MTHKDDEAKHPDAGSHRIWILLRETPPDSEARKVYPSILEGRVCRAPSDRECSTGPRSSTRPELPSEATAAGGRPCRESSMMKPRGAHRIQNAVAAASAARISEGLPPRLLRSRCPHRV